MRYKTKAAFLSVLVVVLAITYILILVFDRDKRRSDVFAWLDPGLVFMADRIEISGPAGRVALNRRNNVWFFDTGNMELPVRQNRVSDLFSLLTRRAIYPVRAASPAAIERLGLTEETAHRIRIRGGVGLPLLDLLIGTEDVLGREVYLRLSGRNQIHSGEGDFTFFTSLSPAAWYDLTLLQPFSIEMVQQADIVFPGEDAFSLRRSGAGWIMLGDESLLLDTIRVEAWLRLLIEAQGEDFVQETPESILGSINLRLGDGTTRFLELGRIYPQERWLITVAGSPFVYSLSDWSFNRIFREIAHFTRN